MRLRETTGDSRDQWGVTSALFRILWKGGQICVSGNEGGAAKPPSLCVSMCKARGVWEKILHTVEAQSSLYMHS